MKAVVTGAAGAQGSAIAAAFAAAGYETLGLVRTARPEQYELAAIDFTDADALVRVLEGADVLAVTSPIDHRPGAREQLAEQMVSAATQAGVACIVLNTAAAIPPDLDRPVAEALRRVRAIFTGGAVPTAVIEPTVYMDNLAAPWSAPAIAKGVLAYPAPRHAPIAWISHKSLGAFAVAAAAHAVLGGRTFEVGGPDNLTGDEVAKLLSAALQRAVRYEETPLTMFAAGINAAFGAPAGDDIADLYRHLAAKPFSMTRDGTAAAKLEVTPEPMLEWAARQSWPGGNAAEAQETGG